MANRLIIRHGTGAPQDGELLPYELGWGGGALYIGGQNTILPINITGNATTATNATNDGNGNNISSTYLSLVGGTLSGNLYIEKNSSWAGFKATRTDSGLSVSCEIGTGGTNHGIFSNGYYDGTNFYSDAKWIIYRDLNGEIQIPSGLKELKLGGHATTVGTVLKASLSAQKTISSEVVTNITSLELPSGTWVITGRVRFSANSTGYRRAGFGTTDSEGAIQVQTPAVTGAVTQLTLTKIIEVSSNTTYYLNAYQNSGSSLSLSAGSNGEINGITAICIA